MKLALSLIVFAAFVPFAVLVLAYIAGHCAGYEKGKADATPVKPKRFDYFSIHGGN